MARLNPITQIRRDAERAAARAQVTPDDMSQNTGAAKGAVGVGHSDPETGEWRAAGITNVTPTGGPGGPFYSAPG